MSNDSDLQKAIQNIKRGFSQINGKISPNHNVALLNISNGIDNLEAHAARSGWVEISEVDLPKSRLAPFTMLVSFSNEEKCQSIKYIGDYVPDYITHIMPLICPPQPPSQKGDG